MTRPPARLGAAALALVLAAGCTTPASRVRARLADRALPAGRTAGPLTVDRDLHVHGAGVGRTTLGVARTGPDDGGRARAAPTGPVLVVPPGRRVVLEDLSLAGRGPGPTVLVRGRLTVRRVAISGGGAAIRVDGGTLDADRLTVAGARSAVEVVAGGRARLAHLTATRLAEAALLAGDGTWLSLRQGSVTVADYGLLVGPGATVDVQGLTVTRPRWAGVGITGGSGRLAGVTVVGPSRHGGILVNDLHRPLALAGIAIRGVTGVGVQVIRGTVTVDGLHVDGVGADDHGGLGDGLLLEAAEARVRALDLRHTAGPGVAVLGGRVRLEGGRIAAGGGPGVVAWRRSRVRLRGVTVGAAGGAAVKAAEGSRVEVRGGRLKGDAGRPAVRCETGGAVHLGGGVRGPGVSCG